MASKNQFDPLSGDIPGKDPSLDYQFFGIGRAKLWRDPERQGWKAVLRADLPEAAADQAEMFQRGDLRLYARSKELTEAARKEEIEAAMAAMPREEFIRRPIYGKDGLVSEGYHVWYPSLTSRSSPPVSSYPDLPHSFFRVRGKWPTRYRRKLAGGKKAKAVWFMHVDVLPGCLRSIFWKARHQLYFLGFVLLTRDDDEMAERQGVMFGEWAMEKRGLIRDRRLQNW